MPELPEVEYMTKKLNGWSRGSRISLVDVKRGKYLPGEEMKDVLSATIKTITRRGKFIIFRTDKGLLVCHNAMSGYWDLDQEPWTFDYVEGSRKATDSDVRVNLVLDDGMILRFHDARLFGSLRFYKTQDINEIKSLKDLGPEAIQTDHAELPDFNWNVLDAAMSGSKHPIKQQLLNQNDVAGIGNIYAAEGLWRAQVSPFRAGNDLNSKEWARIVDGCQEVLKTALERKLSYKEYLKVYRKSICERCDERISSQEIKGRRTYYCSTCQN